jgi:crossover junction endodeoxyribonuclease RuvC
VRVLGIDPGSVCTGYGLIEEGRDGLKVLACGVIRAPRGPLAERLRAIFAELEDLLAAHGPDAVAVEEVFHARNARSALVLGHARGAALLAAGRSGAPVYEYPTKTVKQTVTGSGAADKHQVRRMLQMLLGTVPTALDASDALAVALCHLRFCKGGQAMREAQE